MVVTPSHHPFGSHWNHGDNNDLGSQRNNDAAWGDHDHQGSQQHDDTERQQWQPPRLASGMAKVIAIWAGRMCYFISKTAFFSHRHYSFHACVQVCTVWTDLYTLYNNTHFQHAICTAWPTFYSLSKSTKKNNFQVWFNYLATTTKSLSFKVRDSKKYIE